MIILVLFKDEIFYRMTGLDSQKLQKNVRVYACVYCTALVLIKPLNAQFGSDFK